MNPLRKFLLALVNEEYANGSDSVGIQIKELLKQDKDIELSPELLAEKVFEIYYEDRMEFVELATKSN